ncbi:hypothetical protein OPT61_g4122 [Boeremia exigua]|uniref:Uncharacterized protein n=1 Tax=Boeremia exigua TaxID=749465 RepID=A0ACC2IF95_9PLEO|nr:hypothetical protein OPT61_g4122 [Boeremia exigua]
MSFFETSRNVHLDGLILHAECRTYSQVWRFSKLCLSDVLIFVDDKLCWKWRSKSGKELSSSSRLTLKDSIVEAEMGDGKLSKIDLNEGIKNINGELNFRSVALEDKQILTNDREHIAALNRVFEDHRPFVFEPLSSPTSIRLIKFDYSGGVVGGHYMITSHLFEFELETAPPYIALSYTWGTELTEPWKPKVLEAMLPIECNKKALYITRALRSAIGLALLPFRERRYKFNKTNLICGAENGDVAIVLHELHHGADMAAQDIFGETALHYAAENGHLDVVKILTFAGSDPRLLDKTSRTPLDCAQGARRGSYRDVVEFLTATMQSESHRTRDRSFRLNRSEDQYYWIDAICINQADEGEKTKQVAMMGRIFENAQRVVAWLGQHAYWHEQSTCDLLDEAWRLEEARQTGLLDQSTLDNLLMNPMHSELDVEGSPLRRIAQRWLQALDPNSLRTWPIRTILYERSWFGRAWIMQEIMLAKHLTIIYDLRSLHWDTFAFMTCIVFWARDYLSHGRLPWTADLNIRNVNIAIRVIHRGAHPHRISQALRLARLRQAYRSQGQLSMIDSIILSRSARCQELKDKIFAMVAITNFVEIDEDGTTSMILKYDDPVQTTFVRVSRAMLGVFGLQTLSLCGLGQDSRNDNMPSWVLNLANTNPTLRDTFTFPAVSLPSARKMQWACPTPDELLLRAFKYDIVADVSSPIFMSGYERRDSGLSWLQLLSGLRGRNSGNLCELMWNMLAADDSNTIREAASVREDDFADFVCWLRYMVVMGICGIDDNMQRSIGELANRNFTLKPEDFWDHDYEYDRRATRRQRMAKAAELFEQTGNPLPERPECEVNSDEDLQYYHTLWAENIFAAARCVINTKGAISGQRLFRTNARCKLGSGPKSLQAGDVIVYVPERTGPFAFRQKEGNKYWLIGEIFVQNDPRSPDACDGDLKAFFESDGADFGEDLYVV